MRWNDSAVGNECLTTAVTVAEIRLGIALLPDDKRSVLLSDLAERLLQEDFADRCLPFDFSAAIEYASIVAARTRLGHPISVEDAQIAAIARAGGLALVTRNTKDFLGIDQLTLVNPWKL